MIADAVRDAGFAPLLLDPIDFNGLYVQQMNQRNAEAEGAAQQGAVPPAGSEN